MPRRRPAGYDCLPYARRLQFQAPSRRSSVCHLQIGLDLPGLRFCANTPSKTNEDTSVCTPAKRLIQTPDLAKGFPRCGQVLPVPPMEPARDSGILTTLSAAKRGDQKSGVFASGMGYSESPRMFS